MRIGLIAMSGVRACDPELLEMGMTLPGFVERGKTIAELPSLGLLTLAGMTPREHTCEYLEIEDVLTMPALPDGFDLVGISSFSAQIQEAYQVAEEFRARGVLVVMGGLHVTSAPEEAALHCDAVVVGEGEPVWLNVLRDAGTGGLKQYYRSGGNFPLSESPMPAFEMLQPGNYNRVTVQASRGCPFRCEFCASSILLTSRYKQKPVENVLAEIDRIRECWNRPFIEFADDNAFVNRRYWRELLGELKSRKVRWFAECDLSVYRDAELLTLMRDSGCAQVLIGFESPVESGLKGLELKSDWKRKRQGEYRTAIQHIQSHGVRVNGCFVLGLDGQSPDIFDQVYDFVVDSELYDVQITIQTPFPGTPLHDRLKTENRLLFDGAWERCTLFDVNYRPDPMTVDELRNGFRDLAARLYSEELTKQRRDNFNRKYLKSILHQELAG